MVKNKKVLKEIAKRFAKTILMNSADFAFSETGLNEDEQTYINDQLLIIGDKITNLPRSLSAEDLVDEYYDKFIIKN